MDKPAGVTSHDVVGRVRAERGGKVGHAGTLDPFATGLLIVLLGRATRLQRYLLALSKTYLADARLGWRSSTGDPDGELTNTGRLPAALELPTGQLEQRVPMTSAVRVGGERLYRKAHRGELIETPTRTVTVHRAELIGEQGDRARFEVECASGTYIRTLVETLGDAYCAALRRTAIGPFAVPEAGDRSITTEELTEFMPERELDDNAAAAAAHGRQASGPISPPRWIPDPPIAPATVGDAQAAEADRGPVRLLHEGRVIAIARPEGENLQPEVVLR